VRNEIPGMTLVAALCNESAVGWELLS